jgi:O-antigen/teichoic acid export membrane protein
VPLIALMSFAYLLVVYASNFQRIVVPAIYWNLLSKCTIPVLCVAFAWGYITFTHIFDGLLITYLGILIGVIAYTIWLKQWFVRAAHNDIPKQEMRSVWQFYAYSSVFGVSLTILTQVDALFVGSLINLSSVAIFSVGFFLAEAIDTPRKAILSVSGPLVAKHLTNKEIKETETLYQQVSINQLIAGGWLLLGIWVCSDALFSIMPKGDTFRDARLVILILGFARLFDMAGSLNYEIINYSKHYRILLPLTVSVALMTMLLNYLLIPTYGIYGAAAATALSVLLYNIIKVAYIYRVLHIQPFTWATIKWLFLFLVLLLSSALLKSGSTPWFDFLWKGALATILYAIGVYLLALSPQINSFIAKRLHRS